MKNVIAIRKSCYQHNHRTDSTCFSIICGAAKRCHIKLKESLVILKLKQSFNAAQKSMALYLFDDNTKGKLVNYQSCCHNYIIFNLSQKVLKNSSEMLVLSS